MPLFLKKVAAVVLPFASPAHGRVLTDDENVLLEEWAVTGGEGDRLRAAETEGCSGFLLEMLMVDSLVGVREAALSNRSLPVAAMERFVAAATGDSFPVGQVARSAMCRSIEVLAGNPAFPGALIKEVVEAPFFNRGVKPSGREGAMLNELLGSPACPESVLRTIVSTGEEQRCGGVAVNPNLPLDLMIVLSYAESGYVRRRLASNPFLPEDVALRLALDEKHFVRKAVVSNRAVSEYVRVMAAL